MNSLTEVAYYSRRIIKYGGVGIIGLMTIWWMGELAIKAYLTAFPPKVAPTVRFGVLPKIIFPEKITEKKSFMLELSNDNWPKFADSAKVYVIYQSKSIIGALENGKRTARQMGFGGEPREVKTGVYEFGDAVTNKKLTLNVLTGNFDLSYPYLNDQLLLNPDKIPSKEEAVSTAANFLDSASKLYADLEEGEKKTSFWKIAGDKLVAVGGLAEANLVRVDFFRKQPDDLKIVSEEFDKAAVSVLVSGSSIQSKKIVEVKYRYVSIDSQSPSTYPIKTPQEAYNDLEKGYYWAAKEGNKKEVAIRKVSLAYFEPTAASQFLQPVYVFEGDGDFTAYVPAIIDKYLQ